MKTILHSLFGRAENASGNSLQPAGPHSAHTTLPNASSPDITARRQLVEELLGALLRRSGMPVSWVEPQMLVLSSRTRSNGAHLRLVLKHGDEQVLKYIFALQKQLQKDIHDADSNAPQWLQGISWQLDIDSSCQRTALPDKSFWQPIVEAQKVKPPAGRMLAVTPQAVLQPAHAPALATPPPVVTAASANALPGTLAAATAAPPLPLEALKALRQLREARARVSLPPLAASAEPVAAPTLAAAPVPAQPAPVAASPAKTRGSVPLAKPRLDYGAPNFECSRPAEETDLTPDLAALFALDESRWRPQSTKS